MMERDSFFQILQHSPKALFRLAAKRLPQQLGWELHTLIADIFPSEWFGREDSPLNIYKFQADTRVMGKYAFIRNEISGSAIVSWLAKEEEQAIDNVYTGIGESTKQFKLIVPEWARREGNLNSNDFYTWQPYRYPELPFPHTAIQVYGIDTFDPQDSRPLGGDGLHYQDFSVALRELIYGDTDRQRARSSQPTPMIMIRLVHADGFFHRLDIYDSELKAEVWGSSLLGCHINVSHNTGPIGDMIIQKPGTYSIPIRETITLPLTVALYNGDGETTDNFEFYSGQSGRFTNVVDHMNENISLIPASVQTQTNNQFKYDVALSFAGAQRGIAEELATYVKGAGYKAFYDNDFTVEIWGKDLGEYLDEIYRKEARFCVMLISKDYVERMWTSHERRSAQSRAVEERGNEYILPIMVEHVEVPGLRPTLAYLSLDDYTVEQIGDLLVRKLQQ